MESKFMFIGFNFWMLVTLTCSLVLSATSISFFSWNRRKNHCRQLMWLHQSRRTLICSLYFHFSQPIYMWMYQSRHGGFNYFTHTNSGWRSWDEGACKHLAPAQVLIIQCTTVWHPLPWQQQQHLSNRGQLAQTYWKLSKYLPALVTVPEETHCDRHPDRCSGVFLFLHSIHRNV